MDSRWLVLVWWLWWVGVVWAAVPPLRQMMWCLWSRSVARSASNIGLMEGVLCGEGRENFACGGQK